VKELIKALISIFFLFIFSFSSLFPSEVIAVSQSEDICYSQCTAYKFVWHGLYCYDLFAEHCTEDSGNTIKKTITLLKDVYKTLKSGDNIDTVFKAWFVCKPLIENCIVPHQNQCRLTCKQDLFVYAPDLSVGHPESSFHGVYYDSRNKQLYFKLVNNGLAYAWDIDVEASYGHTKNRDGKITNGTQLFKEKVEHLIYNGARLGPPKSFSDTVGDFLIEESLNGQYLHDFKSWIVNSLELHSDSDNYNVPNYWIKALSFSPVEGELNRVIFNVDGNKIIPESNENNNTYIFELDLRPTPARFSIDSFSKNLIDQTLNSFVVNFKVKNTGEENGIAKIKIFEGKYQEGKTTVFETENNINGLSEEDFETTVNVDAKNEANGYCGKYKEYTLVVFDDEGNISQRSFSLPIYIGKVSGQVKDFFGKPVIGATVVSSTGEETTTNKYGNYSLNKITSLGKITVTASHREYSKTESKEVELKYVSEFEACKQGNLNLYNVDFVLKDKDVIFTVTVKDQSGNPVDAHVLAVNQDFRKEADIEGSGTMPELQPGKYFFTITAPGYKTIKQDVNAVPDNINLVFVLEKLNGRSSDTGLHLITPRLLWEKTLGGSNKEIGNMTGAKNGKLLVVSVADNKVKARSLYFLDFLTGNQIRETSVPWSVEEQRFIGLDTSYDGGTTGLFIGKGVGKTRQNILKLFDAVGNEFGSTTLDNKLGVYLDVSPDGFWVCPYVLLDKSFHKYSQYETEGKGDDDFKRNPATCPDYFLRNNNKITDCSEGLCEKTISNSLVRVIGDITENTVETKYDSSYDNSTVLIRTYKGLYFFGQSNWNKTLESDPSFKSVALSPGGEFAMTTFNDEVEAWQRLKIYNKEGVDKTPQFKYRDVNFVFANDKGMFYAQTRSNKISLYQVGEYDSDYFPDAISPTVSEEWTTGISSLGWAQKFYPIGSSRYADLDPGVIYKADRDLKISLIKPFTQISLGTLTITKDTLFSINYSHDPILLKGQMTADFNSPINIYAIKFDRYRLSLFQTKLNDFLHHLIPEDEYFIVQNIHTKFIVKNEANKINIAVEKGEVKVIGDKINKSVVSGKQIRIDKNNKTSESIYIGFNFIPITIGIILLAFTIIIFKYRKTPFGKKVIFILKTILINILKFLKSLMVLLWKGLKIISLYLFNTIKSFFTKKHEKRK